MNVSRRWDLPTVELEDLQRTNQAGRASVGDSPKGSGVQARSVESARKHASHGNPSGKPDPTVELKLVREALRGVGSPARLSTTVLLTRTGPNPTLHTLEHCPTYQGRRKLIETMGRVGVYRLGTGS